jgi:hypothetical protein
LFQAKPVPVEFDQTAGLKQPSLCCIGNQTLGRRNTAPVQAHLS